MEDTHTRVAGNLLIAWDAVAAINACVVRAAAVAMRQAKREADRLAVETPASAGRRSSFAAHEVRGGRRAQYARPGSPRSNWRKRSKPA